MKDIFEDTRAIAEPAGALAVAGMKKFAEAHAITGKMMAATVSGANTNFDRLRYISERTEIGERREAVLSVTIPERAGRLPALFVMRNRQAQCDGVQLPVRDVGCRGAGVCGADRDAGGRGGGSALQDAVLERKGISGIGYDGQRDR